MPTITEEVIVVLELEYVAEILGCEGVASPVSTRSGPTLPLEVGFGSD